MINLSIKVALAHQYLGYMNLYHSLFSKPISYIKGVWSWAYRLESTVLLDRSE